MKLSRPLREFHPVVIGILIMMPFALGVLCYLALTDQFSSVPHDLKHAYKLYNLQKLKSVFEFTIYDPVHEEINYRGLVFLFVLIINTRKFQSKKWVKRFGYPVAFVFMIVLNYFYAKGHHYHPIAVFGFGLAWGCITIRTGSLLYPIFFHCASNTIAALGIIIGYHLIY